MMPLPPLLGYINESSARVWPGSGGGGAYWGVYLFDTEHRNTWGGESSGVSPGILHLLEKRQEHSVGFNNEEPCNHHGFIN